MKQLIRQHHMDHKLRNVLALAVPPLWTSKYVKDCCSRFQTAAVKAVLAAATRCKYACR